MFCLSDNKSASDYLLAIAPIVVSCGVAFIAWAQYRTNKSKLRLDLYGRRFAVYDKTLTLYQAYYSKSSKSEFLQESLIDFVRAYRESLFLFGRDSDVYKVLTDIKDTLVFLIDFDAKLKTEQYDSDELKEWSKVRVSKPDPTSLMNSLENALILLKYMKS